MTDQHTGTSRLALLIDLERCTGCKSCEAACKQAHGLGPSVNRNKVIWLQGMEKPGLEFLPTMCQHCERPACLRACPVNPQAIRKDPVTGIVSLDEDRCTGCGECVLACPYGAMGFDAKDHHAVKCDLCVSHRKEGETTACASVCPGMAIQFGERETLVAQAEGAGRKIRDTDDYLLGPSTLYLEPLRAREDSLRTVSMTEPGPWQGAVKPVDTAFPYGEDKGSIVADRVEPGGCNICFNACSLNYHFKGDKLVRITGNDKDPVLQGRICPKSQMTLQIYNDPGRLMYPQKRVGKRGESRFERISWEQALDEIAAKMGAVRDQWGTEAVALFAGTRAGVMTSRAYVPLFAKLWGTPNAGSTEALCSSSKAVAYSLTQGVVLIPNSYTPDDIGSSGMYLFIGDNQAETRPVYFGMVNDWRIRNGAKMVTVDPRYTVTASKSDKWLGIRSGTDMALGLALIQHIFSNDLHDKHFCEHWIEGWERWRDFVEEKGYTPDWAESVTDIPAADIRQLAADIAQADGCMIFGSRGLNQHSNGVQTNRVFMFLAACTGNWGRPGGGFFNMASGSSMSPELPESRRAPIEKPMVRRNPAAWIDAMRDGKPYPIKALLAGNNPMSHWPGQEEAREAMLALDLVVHMDLYENETSAYADYLLPVATGIERGGVNRGNDDRRVVWNDKLIDPPGEAKSDGWIWIELGKRFGFDDVLKEEFKEPATFWDHMCERSDDLRGCSTEQLRASPYRWRRYPLPSKDAKEQETLFLEDSISGNEKRFPTPSGRLEFWTETMAEKFSTLGLPILPEFFSEREQLVDLPYLELLAQDFEMGVLSPFTASPTNTSPGKIVAAGENSPGSILREDGFDMELVTGRAAAPHFHSWTHYAWQAQEMWSDLYVQLHPERGAVLGIENGDRVRVTTSHGAIEAMAWLTPGIRKTAAYIPIGWGERQPYNPWKSVNFLTDRKQRDAISDQVNLKTLLCKVEVLTD